jgi:hypothetical protein
MNVNTGNAVVKGWHSHTSHTFAYENDTHPQSWITGRDAHKHAAQLRKSQTRKLDQKTLLSE